MKKDMSKIKCFICHQPRHYASQCLNKKKGDNKKKQQTTTVADIDEFCLRFDGDFLFAYRAQDLETQECGILIVVHHPT